MNLKNIISVKGYTGLYKLIKTTRGGLLLETLDKDKRRLIKNINFTKSTPLDNIALYTTTGVEKSIALTEALTKIHANSNLLNSIDTNFSDNDFILLMEKLIPEYDKTKIPVSQIKKLFKWYKIISTEMPEIFEQKEEIAKEKKNMDIQVEKKTRKDKSTNSDAPSPKKIVKIAKKTLPKQKKP